MQTVILNPTLTDLLPGDLLEAEAIISDTARPFSGEVWFDADGWPMVGSESVTAPWIVLRRVTRSADLPTEAGVYWFKPNSDDAPPRTTNLYRYEPAHELWYHHGNITSLKAVSSQAEAILSHGGGVYKMEVGARVL